MGIPDYVTTLIVALVGGGGVAGIITAVSAWRKSRVEERGIEVEGGAKVFGMATEMLESMKNEIERLSDRVKELEDRQVQDRGRILELEEEVDRLESENRKLRKAS